MLELRCRYAGNFAACCPSCFASPVPIVPPFGAYVGKVEFLSRYIGSVVVFRPYAQVVDRCAHMLQTLRRAAFLRHLETHRAPRRVAVHVKHTSVDVAGVEVHSGASARRGDLIDAGLIIRLAAASMTL